VVVALACLCTVLRHQRDYLVLLYGFTFFIIIIIIITHGQNINLPVCMCLCVCMCVRHTFCQLAYTGHTPQRIFTVDSLKDADFRKDVPFGGIDYK